ncbi:hypothetical protein EJF36_17480 [Bacillus sp. HMF5848]|uniref:hypothetical protein n=1 Tax=Bacillus sp. HMF5848 TaxID=2495421 RepID=UPI000F7938D4|nr:hypothetical protein [Bacillus sp. HMF5848]RSK28514.1 hypothetical protein EJF36_17480 [Bacillus sp. HMF5848]
MNNNQDVMLQMAVTNGKALVILSLINRPDIYMDVVKEIEKNMDLELTSHRHSLDVKAEGTRILYKGSFKEYKDIEQKAEFIMKNPIRFDINFNGYVFEGMMPKGVLDNLRNNNVKEIIFQVSNQFVKGRKSYIKMNQVVVTGIKNISFS